MLTRLSIRNIVLIEQAEIEFSAGLCVLTGETGAGKSILLDALGLALGARGEARLVRSGADSASVTAEFSLSGVPGLAEKLEALGVEEAEEHLIIRRQLSADGKSRAFLNDAPVSAKALREVGEMLVEVHGQHQQRGLLDREMHETLLDAFAGNEVLRGQVAACFAEWKAARQAVEALREEIAAATREKEYLEHMRAELDALASRPGEEEELAERRTRMMQSEKMATTLDEALALLDQPRSVHEALRGAQAVLLRSTLKDAEQFSPAVDALERAMIEAEEARHLLVAIGRASEFSQDELERTEERLFALRAAGRKYNVPLDSLPELFQQVQEKLELLRQQRGRLAVLEKEAEAARAAYIQHAEKLRATRGTAAKKLADAVMRELASLHMEATRFEVRNLPKEEAAWNERGMDVIAFAAATNRGSAVGDLAQIASGGELSRFMLALAVVLGEAKATPVMIFDEIDTGTGGAVADAVGKRLEALGAHVQVLVVTHLPQVAARGQRHLVVTKEEKKSVTRTSVRVLSAAEKREELARMLSGAEVNDKARAAAKHLLEAVG
jgi:DNA repair protein RecN (Recombination protein N)